MTYGGILRTLTVKGRDIIGGYDTLEEYLADEDPFQGAIIGRVCNRIAEGRFTLDGRITAVQILRHHETPGLGANVCDRKFQRTILNLSAEAPEVPENIYLDQFNGKEAAKSGDWKIVKDNGEFIYRTGATVTARAVTALVNDIAAEFAKNRAEIQEKSVL